MSAALCLPKAIAIGLSLGGFITGIRAAYLWWQSTRVPVDPLNGDPNAIESGDSDFANLQWRAAQFRADQQIGRLNARAAGWTALAVVLGTLSSVVGLF